MDVSTDETWMRRLKPNQKNYRRIGQSEPKLGCASEGLLFFPCIKLEDCSKFLMGLNLQRGGTIDACASDGDFS